MAAGEPARPVVAPDRLPDGSMPGEWEQPPRYTRTYYVDQRSPAATDGGDGSSGTPFRTIGRAALAVGPGERVVVGAGVYREHVQPLRGGAGPDEMVGFEAEPGQRVVIRGSVVLPPTWQAGRAARDLWTLRLPEQAFGDHNPFGLVNLDKSDPGNWQSANPEVVCPADMHRRGLIFQDGRRLRQYASVDELAGAPSGYCVDEDGWTVRLRPHGDVDPNHVLLEASARAQAFAPDEPGVDFVRLTGFTVDQVGNGFSYPVEAAVSPTGGHHWIIAGNVVRGINADGVNVGNAVWVWGGNRDRPVGHDCIVRGNVIADCGVSGIKGQSLVRCLIEDNVIENIGWQRVEPGYDNGGMKLLVCADTLIRRNVVRRTTDAPGVWLDWDVVNCRVTNNLFLDTVYPGGAVFVEASEATNWVDHNVVWGTEGNGVYLQDCDGVVVFDNIVGASTASAVDGRVCTKRQLHGRQLTCRGNVVRANVFVDNERAVTFDSPDNEVADNVVVDGWRTAAATLARAAAATWSG